MTIFENIEQLDLAEAALHSYNDKPNDTFTIGKRHYKKIDDYKMSSLLVNAYECTDTKTIIFGIRGTEESRDIEKDVLLMLKQGKSFKKDCERIKKFVRTTMKKYRGYTFYVTGHSLGGYFAQWLSTEMNMSGASFNSPGLQIDPMTNREYTPKFEPKFMCHYVDNDLVGTYQKKYLRGTLVKHSVKHPYTHSMAMFVVKHFKGKCRDSCICRVKTNLIEKLGSFSMGQLTSKTQALDSTLNRTKTNDNEEIIKPLEWINKSSN